LDGVFIATDGEGDAAHRLTAFVVAPGMSVDDLLAALRHRIDPTFLPRPLHIVDELPRNLLGKLPREAVVRLLSERRLAMAREA
jgi:acyl-coenzyme A synthetase/AMP-(fatty) acid ligase